MSRNDDNDRGTFGVDDSNGAKSVQESHLKPMLEPGVIKSFVAGLVVGNLNKGMMMGFVIGALGGIYIQQNIAGVPNVSEAWRELAERWKRTGGNK